MPPLLFLARLIVDDVHQADGRIDPAVPGGAGLHAAAGAALWWPRVAPVCAVGADIELVTHRLLIEDGYVPDGLLVRSPQSVQSRLQYFPDGSRCETPLHGAAHFGHMGLDAADIPSSLLPAAGTYVFHGADPDFWAAIANRRQQLGQLLWEIEATAAVPAQLHAMAPCLGQADIVSLNMAEAATLFGTVSPDDAAERLLGLGARLVVLRLGAQGALAATQGQRVRMRPPPGLEVADETGAGNSFCGGFLAGWCLRSGDLPHALRCGVGAASCTLMHSGPARRSQHAAARLHASNAILLPELVA